MAAIDVTDASFEVDVLERSDSTPVVVDLWAPWCGPCRSLGPIIESVVETFDGALALAKVNVDENPRISQTFQVQSIPAVFAIHRRQVIDRFVGALPERQVREFADRVVAASAPTEADLLVAAGDETSLRKALELEPANDQAITALASLLVERGGDGDYGEALSLLERVAETPERRRLAALARTAMGQGAVLDSGSAEMEARLDSLLARVPGDDVARQEIVDLLETMEPSDPRREQYRRALTAKLF